MDEQVADKQIQDRGQAIRAQAEQAGKAVEMALSLAPIQGLSQIDPAERAIIRLRDTLIGELRQAPNKDAAFQRALEHANLALSLVAGVEYPQTKNQRSTLEMARDALKQAQAELANPAAE